MDFLSEAPFDHTFCTLAPLGNDVVHLVGRFVAGDLLFFFLLLLNRNVHA